MQYLRNRWSDFKNSWSSLILADTSLNLTVLQYIHWSLIIQPHYRVKQLLWKLQFFTGDFFGNTWIIMKNGHQSHQTLILLITMSGSYAWMLQDISTQAKYHQRAEESLANNMGWCATELHLQSHTKLCKKSSSLCESLERTLWTRVEINCFCTEFRTVSKLRQSEMSNFHVFVWFQYKHYDENCNFYSNCFTW